MNVTRSTLCFVLAAISVFGFAQKSDADDIEMNSALMESTFKISDGKTSGTCFVLVRRTSPESTSGRFTLVTAAHVLEAMPADMASLDIHIKDKEGHWKNITADILIRENGKPVWKRHPHADVVAMYVALPQGVQARLDADVFLATDAELAGIEIHPGDEVLYLGFPLGVTANPTGFPVLRSGRIASYPLLPTREIGSFLLDSNVFHGNSGGPVYYNFTNRQLATGLHVGEVRRQIMGLISQESDFTETSKGVFEERSTTHSLGLAIVVPSPFIRETIDLLPK